MACDWWDVGCNAATAVNNAANAQAASAADEIFRSLGSIFASLGTFWLATPTPQVSGTTSTTTAQNIAGPLGEILGWMKTYGLWVAAIALIAAAVLVMFSGARHLARIGWILGGVAVVSFAATIVGVFTEGVSITASPTVAFVRTQLSPWTLGVAAGGVIVGGTKMMIEARGQAVRDLLQGLGTLLLVMVASVSGVQLLTSAFDTFSTDLMNQALSCDSATSSTCFGKALSGFLGISNPATGQLGVVLIIVIGLLALLFSLVQLLLMEIRGVLLILLTGILPTIAAFATTDSGRKMFRTAIGWLTAALLYKPVAAIIFATGFQLVGSNSDSLRNAVDGLLLLGISTVALPALIRFVSPIAAAGGGGGGGAAAAMMAAGAAVPVGAQLMQGARSASQEAASAPSSESTADGAATPPTAAPSGSGVGPTGGEAATAGSPHAASPGGGSAGAAAPADGGASSSGGGSSPSGAGSSASTGVSASGSTAGAASGSTATAGGGGAASAGSAAGAAAGAAAGVAGVAVQAAQGTASVARQATEEATGEGGVANGGH